MPSKRYQANFANHAWRCRCWVVVPTYCKQLPSLRLFSIAQNYHQKVPTKKYRPKVPPKSHPYARKSASHEVLSRMQLTLHATGRTPHGASRLVLAKSAWSVKTRRAPSRHCRDGRVYGHTTAAMHDMCTSPPPRDTAAFDIASLFCEIN